MANKKDHLNQAKHNEALAEYISTTPYLDWVATLKFYAALHYVQAYFLSLSPPQNPQSHSQRAIAMDNDTYLDPIRDDYRDLQDVSQACRYACWKPDSRELKLTDEHLRTIKKYLRQYIG